MRAGHRQNARIRALRYRQRLEFPLDALVPAVILQRFLAIESERRQYGGIAVREEHRLTCSGMFMPHPARHHECVLLVPIEAPAGNDGGAFAFDYMEYFTAGMAARLGVLSRP